MNDFKHHSSAKPVQSPTRSNAIAGRSENPKFAKWMIELECVGDTLPIVITRLEFQQGRIKKSLDAGPFHA